MIPFLGDAQGLFRSLLGAAFVLWLPGYVLTATLFGRDELDRVQRTLMTLGLSISLAILIGFGLNLTGFSLTPLTLGIGLSAVTLVAGTIALARPTHRPRLPRLHARRSLRKRDGFLFGTAALLVVVAIGLERIGADAQPQTGFTELSMFSASPDDVRLGVQNEEAIEMTYRVALMSGTAVIAEWPAVQLKRGQRWDMQRVLPANQRAGVELLLHRADAPDEIYRRVTLGTGATSVPSPPPLPSPDPTRNPDVGLVTDRILALIAAVAAASLVWIWLAAWSRGAKARRRSEPAPAVRRGWPSVTVIIPAWQERATIGRCIASLHRVDYATWETVIVAGGSDDTYGVATREGERLANCRVLEQQPLGKPAALNVGLHAATGKVIVLLDADSRVSPQWLRALVAPLSGIIRATTGNPMPSRLTPIARSELMERLATYEVQRSAMLQGSGSIAIWRDLIDELGGFPEDVYADDWDLDARLASAGVVRAYSAAATLLTERPASLGEFWRNELRWRRAHLISLFRLRDYFFRDVMSALRNLYPYIAGWATAVLTAVTVAALVAGDPDLARRAFALLAIAILWLSLRCVALVLQVVAYTGERRWLRDAWAPPFLFLITMVACCVASLSTHRATLHFKGPRWVGEDEPGL